MEFKFIFKVTTFKGILAVTDTDTVVDVALAEQLMTKHSVPRKYIPNNVAAKHVITEHTIILDDEQLKRFRATFLKCNTKVVNVPNGFSVFMHIVSHQSEIGQRVNVSYEIDNDMLLDVLFNNEIKSVLVSSSIPVRRYSYTDFSRMTAELNNVSGTHVIDSNLGIDDVTIMVCNGVLGNRVCDTGSLLAKKNEFGKAYYTVD